ncbi:MAG: glycoside hydrolase family 127 protein [Planctomycetales bacterium]|nr:glycoside hydrolase family 127 protein [Planctomycetales bacterium]
MSRLFGLLLLALFVRVAVGSDAITDTDSSPHAVTHAIGLSEVQWTGGFWADRFAVCRDRSVPAMWELMKGDKYKPYYQHFLIAAGKMDGKYHGAKWNDGDFYKWIEAACSVLAVTEDPKLSHTIDSCIKVIGQAQRDDGYIHTPVLIANRNGDTTVKPLQDRHNFEMYNMGHLITAACIHHRVTGKEDFLDIAKKTAAFLLQTFANPTPELARNSVCPSHYMAMVELYRTTGNPQYLKLASKFIEMRNIMRDGGDDNQDRIPFVEQREAIGHAVRANYLFAGAADLYLETGDGRYMNSLDAIWENVTRKKLYITGGCGALYDGASPDGSNQQSVITRVHQSYGRNYQLPNVTAHNETCAAIGSVLWNWRMFLATGQAKFIDLMELTLYNSVLSGVSLEGTDYFYVNPLRNEKPLPTDLRWSRARVPFVTSYCCPPNVVRTVAQVNGYAYAKRNDTISVNLYGGNKLSTNLLGEPLSIVQTTQYPWEGSATFTVEKCTNRPFSIELRVPSWTDTFRLQINDVPVDAEKLPSGFVSISRTWEEGDVLQIEFDMPAKLIESHPLVEETRNHVAVKRGPIVYCLESNDLPKSVRVREVALPSDAVFSAVNRAADLNGLTCLQTQVTYRPEGDWASSLYRQLQNRQTRKIETQFIPYFAWANRGDSEMSVWIPLAE